MEEKLFLGFLSHFTLSHAVHFGNDNLYNGKVKGNFACVLSSDIKIGAAHQS